LWITRAFQKKLLEPQNPGAAKGGHGKKPIFSEQSEAHLECWGFIELTGNISILVEIQRNYWFPDVDNCMIINF
jgi:hypothetical protein